VKSLSGSATNMALPSPGVNSLRTCSRQSAIRTNAFYSEHERGRQAGMHDRSGLELSFPFRFLFLKFAESVLTHGSKAYLFDCAAPCVKRVTPVVPFCFEPALMKPHQFHRRLDAPAAQRRGKHQNKSEQNLSHSETD
jgi:hypothetical protein